MVDISQRVIWTACPAGVSEDRKFLLINLHVAPRLTLPAGTDPADLSQFPAWQDWPAVIQRARFSVQGFGPDREGLPQHESVTATWQALLPVETPVQTHAFDDYRGKDVLTAPLASLAERIETTYAELAVSTAGAQLPPARDFGRIDLFGGREQSPPLSSLLALLRDTRDVEAIKSSHTMLALLEAYHRPLATQKMREAKKRMLADGTPDPLDPHEDTAYRTVERVEMPQADTLKDQFDFHRVVSAIGQHPELMRACGLVIPLQVERDGIADGPHPLFVKVEWDRGDVLTLDDVFCITRTTLKDDGFVATPSSNLVEDGWLLASAPGFNLVQLDVDGAGLSVKNFSRQLPRMREERFDDEEPHDPIARAGAPRLRTAGIQFAQDRRDVAIRGLFDNAGGHDDKIGEGLGDGQPVILNAEDLIKGWRVDVHDKMRDEWQSLMRFDGTYTLLRTDTAISTDDEEATSRLAATETADDTADTATKNILKASEALIAWNGWSLAAPAPGRVVMPDDAESVGDAPGEVPDGLPLATRLQAHPKSLPALRFGRVYRMRLRSSDLTGWGPGYTSKDAGPPKAVSGAVKFGRYEPVETPVLTLVNGAPEPADGESMPRAALRTMDDPDRDTKIAARNVSPARVGHRFAETHGVIDDANGRPRGDMFPLLSTRDAAYAEITVTTKAWVADPPPGEPAPAPADVSTKYSISSERDPTPYLPDPLAAGCAIRVTGVPGIDPHEIHFISFYHDGWKPEIMPDWPNERAFAIVSHREGVFGWDADRRRFNVPLDKAERARLYISALIPDPGIDYMKMKELIIRRFGAEGWKKVEFSVKRGQHWMFTPDRMIELVHAVQRPLIVPRLMGLSADRNPGKVACTVRFRTPIHSKSTVRLDVDGEWLEIDDVSGPDPIVRKVRAHGFDRKLFRLEAPGNVISVEETHIFADTRARHVEYQGTATTRFREYMPPDIRGDAEQMIVRSQVDPLWIPSSTRPPAPGVRYIIPTFGWSRTGAGTPNQRSWRRGGGIRVYLDRPWFTTGTNEMLAVCLPRGSEDPQVSASKNYVTQWGTDPSWLSHDIDSVAPRPRDFTQRVAAGPIPYFIPPSGTPDPLDADPSPDGAAINSINTGPYVPAGAPLGVEVDIVPHAVGYDRERKLWYCDIVVQPGDAYFPFIRLALARFQPSSIQNHHLSSVVLADFAQLTADRLAIVAPGSDQRSRKVSVYGIVPDHGARMLPRAGDIRFELQMLKAGGDPDLDWKPAQGIAPPPPPPAPRPGEPIAGGRFLVTNRVRLTSDQRIRLAEAERLVSVGEFEAVLVDPGLFEMLRPPLIAETVITPPMMAAGDRLRILITEVETYETQPGLRPPRGTSAERIVYAETIAL